MPVGRRPPWVKISQRGPADAGDPLGVDRDDNALAAEFLRRLTHEKPVRHRCRIDRGLVGAGEQQIANVVGRPDAAADRQRHEAHFRRTPDDVEQDPAILMARGNVEEAEFVRPGPVVGDGALDRIAGVPQIDEIDALDDPAVLDVEAGNDPGLQRHRRTPSVSGAGSGFGLRSARAARGSRRPS